MSRFVALIVSLVIFSGGIAFASVEKGSTQQSTVQCEQATDFSFSSYLQKLDSGVSANSVQQCTVPDPAGEEKMAGRGCCSWHDGVCGCSNGRALCCDGQLSPSCGC